MTSFWSGATRCVRRRKGLAGSPGRPTTPEDKRRSAVESGPVADIDPDHRRLLAPGHLDAMPHRPIHPISLRSNGFLYRGADRLLFQFMIRIYSHGENTRLSAWKNRANPSKSVHTLIRFNLRPEGVGPKAFQPRFSQKYGANRSRGGTCLMH